MKKPRGGTVLFLAVLFWACFATASAADLKIKFTDKSKLKYEGDWMTIAYQAYTSKLVGKGARKGTLTCKPNISGTYQIITEFKSTENRGNRALYYVDGKLAKEIDQKSGTGKGQSHFPKVSLGVFALTPESTVELRCQDGKSYSFVAFIFTTSTEKPSEGGSDTTAGGSADSSTDAASKDSEQVFTATSDGDMTIHPFLSTYDAAELRVLVDGKEVLAWVRTDSTSNELCVFQGAADENSMKLNKPGDYSPASGLKYSIALKTGQKVTVIKKGDFEPATFLKVEGPFNGKPSAPTASGSSAVAAGSQDVPPGSASSDIASGSKSSNSSSSLKSILNTK